MVAPCLNKKLHCYKCNYGVLWLRKGQETATPHSYLSKTAQLVSLVTGVSHAAAAMQQIQKLTHELNPDRLIDHSLEGTTTTTSGTVGTRVSQRALNMLQGWCPDQEKDHCYVQR